MVDTTEHLYNISIGFNFEIIGGLLDKPPKMEVQNENINKKVGRNARTGKNIA